LSQNIFNLTLDYNKSNTVVNLRLLPCIIHWTDSRPSGRFSDFSAHKFILLLLIY